MKQLIGRDQGAYLFNPSTGQITIIGLNVNLAHEQVDVIVATKTNTPLYNFYDPTVSTMTISNNVITINNALTSSMLASDPLMIYVDIPTTAPNDQASAIDTYIHPLLTKLTNAMQSLQSIDSSQRLRVTLDSITTNLTLTTITTVSTVTNVTTLGTITNAIPVGNVATIGGSNFEYQIMDMARDAYNTGIRTQLVFSN